jgi:hypothetical protein
MRQRSTLRQGREGTTLVSDDILSVLAFVKRVKVSRQWTNVPALSPWGARLNAAPHAPRAANVQLRSLTCGSRLQPTGPPPTTTGDRPCLWVASQLCHTASLLDLDALAAVSSRHRFYRARVHRYLSRCHYCPITSSLVDAILRSIVLVLLGSSLIITTVPIQPQAQHHTPTAPNIYHESISSLNASWALHNSQHGSFWGCGLR